MPLSIGFHLALAALLPLSGALKVPIGETQANATVNPHRVVVNYLTDEQKNASLKVWTDFLESQDSVLKSLPVVAAAPENTDRVALTIMQPATHERIALMAKIIRLNSHRLGPKWAIQVMFAQDHERDELDALLGHPKNVIYSPITLFGGKRLPEMSRYAFSYWLLDMDFWNQVHPQHEHVLIFGDDSIVLRGNGCIDKFLYYDYVGAPWNAMQYNMPKYGGNGGFSLRRRSTSIAMIHSDRIREVKVPAPTPARQKHHEDEAFVRLIHETGGIFPGREAASRFCVETIFDEDTCAFHKPWLYQDPARMRRMFEVADSLPAL